MYQHSEDFIYNISLTKFKQIYDNTNNLLEYLKTNYVDQIGWDLENDDELRILQSLIKDRHNTEFPNYVEEEEKKFPDVIRNSFIDNPINWIFGSSEKINYPFPQEYMDILNGPHKYKFHDYMNYSAVDCITYLSMFGGSLKMLKNINLPNTTVERINIKPWGRYKEWIFVNNVTNVKVKLKEYVDSGKHWQYPGMHESWQQSKGKKWRPAYITDQHFPILITDYIEEFGYDAAIAESYSNSHLTDVGLEPGDPVKNTEFSILKNISHVINNGVNSYHIILLNIKEFNGPTLIKTGGHLVALILDRIRQKVVYFDPHGSNKNAIHNFYAIHLILGQYVTNEIDSWTFETNTNHETSIWQMSDMFCQTWSILFSILYIINPNLDMISLYTTFSNGDDVRYLLLFTFLYWTCNDRKYTPDNMASMKLNRQYAPNRNVMESIFQPYDNTIDILIKNIKKHFNLVK